MTISVHSSVSLPHRGVNLASGLKALPSNLRHPLDRHQDGILKFHTITHLLVAVEAGEDALDNLCSTDVADEVLVDRIVALASAQTQLASAKAILEGEVK